ncbi:MAG: hypothetical protein IKL06_02430 [Lachnospiraceae bacterium]|nr:hypothetical protein [Lachnospiraceae bacterium]
MKYELKGKKLLVLGGGSQHCKVVEADKEMGVITYVTDNVENSPAKTMADYAYMINVTETERLAELCREEKIDGIISGWFDFVQPYYQKLCEATGLPCYGTKQQFDILTRKKDFKDCCLTHGVGVPARLTIDEIGDKLPFKVIVKPSNSRGSRGATICTTKEEVIAAVKTAIEASYDGQYVIEQYIDQKGAFCVTYMFINGEAYLEQLSDAYFGDKEYGLDRVAVAYRSPSVRSEEFLKKENGRIIEMLKAIGVENGPFVAQGFFTEDDVLFFDPGRRFAGGEYERAFKRTTGIDMPKAMITFALTGVYPAEEYGFTKESYLLNGKTTIRLQINVRAGVVAAQEGFDVIEKFPEVEYTAFYHEPGDEIQATGNTHQRYAHIIVVADNSEALKDAVKKIYKEIKVLDANNDNMIVSLFDPELI